MSQAPVSIADLMPLEQAFTLHSQSDNPAVLTASIAPDFSNGPIGMAPEVGFPFGGLLASLAIRAMSEGLSIAPTIRTLDVQFAAPARYNIPIEFTPHLLRSGRTTTYARIEAHQNGRLILHATGTFGQDAHCPLPYSALHRLPPHLSDMQSDGVMNNALSPRFTRYVDYRFETGPHLLGGKRGKPAMERLWMRTRDAAPLDALRLSFLLDALYPPVMTLSPELLKMTSVDLRYDILRELTPDVSPDGWVFFETNLLEHDFGWSLDDITAWAADGRPVALARQRRKLL